MALGLPRRIGSPAQGTFRPTTPGTMNGRHTSPVRIHVDRVGSNWLVRAVAFPATHLPDLQTSLSFLDEFLKDFEDDLRRRAGLNPPSTPSSGGSAGGRGTGHPRSNNSPAAPAVPTITRDEIKQRITDLGTGERRLFQLSNRNADGTYQANRFRPATVQAGYQSDGGWIVTNAPDGLANAYVIAECHTNSKRAKFIEVFGQLPPTAPPRRQGRR